ncbi:2'-5' RNA ligase family protein, partial [Escherichia coli]|uniref:2'-5' RNA ligase family protein n=1 Tax=Escherichia coli TaxID=562 RepID=UPI0032E48D59
MRSIELVFDDSTESVIRSDWARLAVAGIPSLAGHASASNRPHITLAAGPDLPLSGHQILSGSGHHILAGHPGGLWRDLPFDVEFSGMQVFAAAAGKYVLARSLVMTGPLFHLHRALHEGITEAAPLTLPDAWTPHVT